MASSLGSLEITNRASIAAVFIIILIQHIIDASSHRVIYPWDLIIQGNLNNHTLLSPSQAFLSLRYCYAN